MNSPLLLAAIAFLAVIIVGTVLVALNDWLESVLTAEATSGSGNQRRSSAVTTRSVGRAGFATGRTGDCAEVFGNAFKRRNLVMDPARTRNSGRKIGSLGWRA